jgi:uncharacterized alpha-E superfamily protein
MLARVAEALYWTARNLERADNVGRMLEMTHALALDTLGDPAGPDVWMPPIVATGDAEVFREHHLRASERSVVWFLTFSEVNGNSLRACTNRARQNARGVRDALPPDVWEEISALSRAVNQWTPRRLAHDGVFPLCRVVRRGLHQIEGSVDAEMMRGEAWHFLRIGRFLERASTAARLLEARWRVSGSRSVTLHREVPPDEWRALVGAAVTPSLLMSASPGALTVESAVRLLVQDERFPRSVRYALDRVEDSLLELEAMGASGRGVTGRGMVADARHRVEQLDPLPIGPQLTDLLDEIQERCNLIGSHIASCFFDYPHDDPTGHDRQRPQAARQAQN